MSDRRQRASIHTPREGFLLAQVLRHREENEHRYIRQAWLQGAGAVCDQMFLIFDGGISISTYLRLQPIHSTIYIELLQEFLSFRLQFASFRCSNRLEILVQIALMALQSEVINTCIERLEAMISGLVNTGSFEALSLGNNIERLMQTLVNNNGY